MLKIHLNRNLIFFNPPVKTREELFRFLASKAKTNGLIEDKNPFITALNSEENRGKNVTVEDVAIPHVKCSKVKKPFVSIVIFEKGFKYCGTEPNKRVKLVFCIGSPEKGPSYLALFADISRLLIKEDFKTGLINAHVMEDVLSIVATHSIQEYATKKRQEKKYLVTLVINKKVDNNVLSSIFLEANIHCPTEVHTENFLMKNFKKIPFLSSYARSMINVDCASRTIFGVTDDTEAANKLFYLLKAEKIDLEAPGVGVLYMSDLLSCFGGIDEDIGF